MQIKTLFFILLLLLSGCTTQSIKNVALEPIPREISSPDELPEELASRQVYWQNSFVHLSGEPIEYDPFVFLNEQEISGVVPILSHNERYLVYGHGNFSKISIWDLNTNKSRELINTSEDLSHSATIGGIAFTPNDDMIFFSYNWHSDNGETHAGLATIDLITGAIVELDIAEFQIAFHDIDVSSDGEWVATDMVALDKQVCLLINLERQKVECMTFNEGWYSSVNFTNSNDYIAYSHHRKINSPSSIMLSKIDGTENQQLVSGLAIAEILFVTNNEIVFAGATYDKPKCGYLYVINHDGNDLRKLSYLGEQCLSEE